jgi:hypothetical protein
MAGEWIKVTKLWEKGEVGRLADILDLSIDDVIGKLVRLWHWASDNTYDGNATFVTPSHIEREIVRCEGFCQALESVGWLTICDDVDGANGGIVLPHFDRHNGQSAKKRALTAMRVAKHRKEKDVTPSPLQDSGACNGPSPLLSSCSRSRSTSKKKEPIDTALVALCRWWNELHAAGWVSCSILDPESPSAAVQKGWARVQEDAELAAMVGDSDKLEAAIRVSPFVNAGWFRLEKLLGGKNKSGELVIRVLLEGGYRDKTPGPTRGRVRSGTCEAVEVLR